MTTYTLEPGQYTLTINGHVSPEYFLDVIEARGYTCDIERVTYGYHVTYQGEDIMWVDDSPPPDVPDASPSRPVTFARGADLRPVSEALIPTGDEPEPQRICPWCGTARMREMTHDEIKARFHLDDDGLEAHLVLGTHYICACSGVTIL